MSTNVLLCLMSLLIFKHFVVDFPMQTERMVNEKGTYGAWGGIEHSGLHGWATMIIVTTFLITAARWEISIAGIVGTVIGLADAVAHYHIDWAKMNLSRDFTIKDKMYWTLLGLDQMLHYLTYVLLISIVMWIIK